MEMEGHPPMALNNFGSSPFREEIKGSDGFDHQKKDRVVQWIQMVDQPAIWAAARVHGSPISAPWAGGKPP